MSTTSETNNLHMSGMEEENLSDGDTPDNTLNQSAELSDDDEMPVENEEHNEATTNGTTSDEIYAVVKEVTGVFTKTGAERERFIQAVCDVVSGKKNN
jgi:hypothetical protein